MSKKVNPNYTNEGQHEQSYMPNQYDYNDRGYTDSFYDEYEYVDSGAGSFLLGAVVGGVIGAVAALFLAPKTGKEMREDFTSQAGQLKEKGIEISAVAKDKATEFTSIAKDKATEYSEVAKNKATEYTSVAKEKASEYSSVAKDKASGYTSAAKDKASEISAVAKEKTEGVTKSIQEQSGQIVDKVKSIRSKTSIPMDDGTVSAEGEEPTDYIQSSVEELADEDEITTTAEAIKEAVVKTNSNN